LANDDEDDIITEERFTIEVDGLACSFCAYGLEKKLYNMDSIDSLVIDINEGLVKIFLKKDKQISKSDINARIEEAGFTLQKFIISGKEYYLNKNENK